MIDHNCDRPVNLLDQHDPRKPMRPSHCSQRKHKIGALKALPRMSLGSTDQESQAGCAAIDLALYEFGESLAAENLASLIDKDCKGFGLHEAPELSCFFFLPFIGSW